MLINVPFSTSEELQRCMGSLYVSFDFDKMQDSLAVAADRLMDSISKPVYDRAVELFTTPYDSTAVDSTTIDTINKLVEMVQYPLAQMAFYEHFIWLQLNIKSDRITTHKSDDETTLYKYQADEAKASLLKRYGIYLNMLIDFLNTNKTLFPEWTASEQYTTLQSLPLTTYKEFDTYFGIDADASFFIRCRQIMKGEVFEDEILPIIGELSSEIKASATAMRKINRFLVYRTMELAVFRFDYNLLPAPIRRDIDNEMSKKNSEDFKQVKEKIYRQIQGKANEYRQALEMWKAQDGKTAADLPYTPYEQKIDETDRFVYL